MGIERLARNAGNIGNVILERDVRLVAEEPHRALSFIEACEQMLFCLHDLKLHTYCFSPCEVDANTSERFHVELHVQPIHNILFVEKMVVEGLPSDVTFVGHIDDVHFIEGLFLKSLFKSAHNPPFCLIRVTDRTTDDKTRQRMSCSFLHR